MLINLPIPENIHRIVLTLLAETTNTKDSVSLKYICGKSDFHYEIEIDTDVVNIAEYEADVLFVGLKIDRKAFVKAALPPPRDSQ